MSLQSSSVKIHFLVLKEVSGNFFIMQCFLMILFMCMFIFNTYVIKRSNKSVPFNHEHLSFIQGS